MKNENDLKETAVKELAPCGLDCSRCVDFKGGKVSILSNELLQALEGYEHIAVLAKAFAPALAHYDEFIAILIHFSNAGCMGCRFTETGGCQVRACHKEHQVDFCAQCPDYPCQPKMFNEHLLTTWHSNNDMIQSNGLEAFYIAQKQKPRY